jgi:Flp pilus assembly protein TadG
MTIAYFGMIDVTNLLAAKRRVTIASSTISDLVAQADTTITGADITGFYSAIGPIMAPFPQGTIGVQVFDYKIDSSNNVTLRWQHSTGVSCGAPSTSGYAALMTSDKNDLIVAKACITLMPITGKVIANTNYTLRKETILRPRQSLTLTCTSGC